MNLNIIQSYFKSLLYNYQLKIFNILHNTFYYSSLISKIFLKLLMYYKLKLNYT